MVEHFIACQYSNSNIAYVLDNALNKSLNSILQYTTEAGTSYGRQSHINSQIMQFNMR